MSEWRKSGGWDARLLCVSHIVPFSFDESNSLVSSVKNCDPQAGTNSVRDRRLWGCVGR